MKNIGRLLIIGLVCISSGCATLNSVYDHYKDVKEQREQRKEEERLAKEEERRVKEEQERLEAEERARLAREERERQEAIDAAVVKVPVTLDYKKPWTIKLTGDFRASGHGRYIQSGKTLRDGIDIWNWNGRIAFRLYNELINFTVAEVGSLSSPKPPDHWAYTTPQSGVNRWSGEMIIEYNPTGNCKLYRNGTLIGSWGFRIIKTPPIRRELWLRGFEGVVVIE